ncbi:MAG: AzlC family ABC transporter permease [Rhodospirillales bacterium]
MTIQADRSGWWQGLTDAVRAPGIALGAALVGYGAQAATNGLDVTAMLAAALLIWALPPMMAFTELYSAGASVSALIISIGLINVRALPMIVATLPLVHGGTGFRLWHLLLAQVSSPTSWAQMELMHGELQQHQRAPYYFGFCAILITFGLVGSLIGFFLVDDVPTALRLAALFLTPFFVLLMMGTAKRRPGQAAGICGAIGVPVCIDLIPDFGMIVGGLLFGTVGYLAGSLIRRFEERNITS